jgi:hypothetical protein
LGEAQSALPLRKDVRFFFYIVVREEQIWRTKGIVRIGRQKRRNRILETRIRKLLHLMRQDGYRRQLRAHTMYITFVSCLEDSFTHMRRLKKSAFTCPSSTVFPKKHLPSSSASLALPESAKLP